MNAGGKRSPVPRSGSRQQQQQQQQPSSNAAGSRQRRERQHSQQGGHCRLSPPRSERVSRKSYGGTGSGGGGGARRGSGESTGSANSANSRRGSREQCSNNNSSSKQSGQWLDPSTTSSSPSPSMLQQPHRSQSFRHRPRPNALLLGARGAANNNSQQLQNPQQQLGGEVDSTPERRRSTPTIHRRASLSRGAARVEPRIDVWPRAKPMSEAEERFLQLPDFADYTRVRQFNIDAKGAVIHRGDSFRRKRPSPVPASSSVQQQQPHSNGHSSATASESFEHQQQQQIQQQEQQEDEEDQQNRTNSARTSVSSLPPTAHPQQQQGKQSSPAATSSIALRESALQNGSTHSNSQSQHSSSAPISDEGTSSQQISSYRICVLGQAGAGKSSLVAQFVSSSAFGADLDMELPSCNGSSSNGGQQSTAASPNGNGIGGGGGDSCVSVNIGGHECELLFQEWDLPEQQEQLHQLSSQLARRCGSGQFHALVLVYSIDRRASFRVALRTLELLRSGGCPSPLLLVGNKADLERKRAVGEAEVKAAMLTYDVPHFEVSVALNHDVDDLLVGIVAQVKESFRMNVSDQKSHSNNNSTRSAAGARASTKEDSTEDFHAAIRRFSQRKKRQMGVAEVDGMQTGKCMNLFEKLRKWRKGTSNC